MTIPPRKIQIGTYVTPEGWRGLGERLEEGLAGFCDFYLPTGYQKPLQTHIAVNVKITGRRPIWRQGAFWLRVKITFVGDGEPDTYTGGWVLFYEQDYEGSGK